MSGEVMGGLDTFPRVGGTCPACGNATLFLGVGGWPTCGYIPCPSPTMTTADEVAKLLAERDLAYSVLRRMVAEGLHHHIVGMNDDQRALVERMMGEQTDA